MIESSTPTYCANHPGVETSLRCNKCGKPICAKCAVRTPTGYRCKECVRGQLKIFDTARWYDYLLGSAIAGILGFLASLLATLVSRVTIIGWILIVVGAPTAGMIIAEGVRLVTRKHRSRPLFITIAAAVVIGALPVILFQLFTGNIFNLIFQGIYLFIATPIVYTRLSGIQLNR
jgi:B-box zinc finger